MDKDDEALLDRLIEIICGDKMIGAESALLLLKKDAERYRFLREHGDDAPIYVPKYSGFGSVMVLARGEQLDAALDAALIDRKE